MLWILYNRGWSEAQGYVSVVAWWRMHHRKVTPEMLEELERLAERVWNELKEKKMKKRFEKQQNSLRNRIIALLQQHPATAAFLAEKLGATSKAVDSHLYRLRRDRLVARLSWGLYALATVALRGAGPKHTATTADECPTPAVRTASGAQRAMDSLDGIDECEAPPSALRSLSCREAPSAAPNDRAWAPDEMMKNPQQNHDGTACSWPFQ